MDSTDDKDAAARVHFPEDQLPEHDSEIVVKNVGTDRCDIHLGFLQFKHVYEVKLSVQDNLGEDIDFDHLENLHARITDIMPCEDGSNGHDIILEFTAHREKLLQERLTIKSHSDPSMKMLLMFRARVLGKGKGTPSLRNGIRCIRVDWDEDSDFTDWQGFD